MTSLVDKFIHRYGRLPTEFDPDYLEMLRMNKYRILAVPDVKPAKCGNCGSTKNDGRGYIDFGLEIDWYGAVFLCGMCLKDIASAMGLFEQFQKDVQFAKDKLVLSTDLQTQGMALQETILHTFEEVKSYFANLQSIGSNSTPDSTSDVDSNKNKSNTEAIDGSNGQPAEVHKRTSKSTTSSGSKDLPSLAELLNSKP